MRQMKKRTFPGTTDPGMTERERKHAAIARRAAAEGMVLLKNEDHFLPLQVEKPVALYGTGASQTIKGGTGSGDVNERKAVSIWEGMKNAGYRITNEDWLFDYDAQYEAARLAWRDDILSRVESGGSIRHFLDIYASTPFVMPAGQPVNKTEADTAFYVLSRVAGEGADRFDGPGDYLLTPEEKQQLDRVCSLYPDVVVVINTGGLVDLSFVDTYANIRALLYIVQPGMEGGNAFADVVSGRVTPSGKLTDTWALRYEDYPNSASFSHNNGNTDKEYYTEGIYTGYRYFDTFGVPVRYSFGYGLSYTEFSLRDGRLWFDEQTKEFVFDIRVTNTGTCYSGREVVQLYVTCPVGDIEKEYRRLAGFAKTRLLSPGESETLKIRIAPHLLASYSPAAPGWMLEAGPYVFWAGESLESAVPVASADLLADVLLSRTRNICPLKEELTEIRPDEEQLLRRLDSFLWQVRSRGLQELTIDPDWFETEEIVYRENRALAAASEKELVDALTEDQLIALASGDPQKGQGANIGSAGVTVPGSAGETSTCAEEQGLAFIVLADGPAGLRLTREYHVKDGHVMLKSFMNNIEGGLFCTEPDPEDGEKYFQYCTAIPVGTLLAQTWDTDLLREAGAMIGREMEEFGVTLWLAPGMNIHRNPLCGRNFEYYSEDPLVAGRMAAAITQGVQSVPGCGTTIKHFACNNQEDNRKGSDSIVSERALREIYLKGFEIAVKEARPMSIMTSYNLINGVHAANNADLCTRAARCEWGFDGVIMTDWTTTEDGPDCTASGCMRAGNDLVMPGAVSDAENLRRELREGTLDPQDLKACISRLARIIHCSNQYEEAVPYPDGKAWNAGFRIREIRVNEMITPLGIDVGNPVFSWILESREQDLRQTGVRIRVGTAPGSDDCWDSGLLKTDRSIGIRYEGAPLAPCTRYYVSVCVRDQKDRTQEAGTWFETGLMDPDRKAWDGAAFIGAPESVLASDSISVFTLEASFRIEEGGRAGIIFGDSDRRLLDRFKNEMLLEGPNQIRFVVNVDETPAVLEIYRIGYAPEDKEDRPLYVIPIRDVGTQEELITEETKHLPHMLEIDVTGNGAYTWLDGHLIDEERQQSPFGERVLARQLNPLGITDVTTYPRLYNAGFYAGEGTRVSFPKGLVVRNYNGRKIALSGSEEFCPEPGAVLAVIGPEGRTLTGEAQEVQDPSCHSLPMFRRSFEVWKAVRKARLYVTARGIYACRINGRRIGDEYFSPGASQFDKHLLYQTYDLTDSLQPGENVLGCILAPGWWSDSFSFLLDNYHFWGDRPSFLAKLVVTYEDGAEDVIVTDPETWDYFGEGPYRYAGFFNGEQFDARRVPEMEDFFMPGAGEMRTAHEIKVKKPVEICPVPMPERAPMFPGAAVWPARNAQEPCITGHYQAPVRAVECLTARSVSEPRPGVYIYDLGQEIAGVPVITFREKEGQRITIRYGEMRYPAMERYKGLEGLLLQANLREASNTDVYICAGNGDEVYQPEFTFHGYRYIEITGAENPPELPDVRSLLLSSVERVTGDFCCSEPLVNRFVENVRYSQYDNFISIPTDCPQRNERMGWLGDTHIFCHAANLQSHVKNFYIRNLQAMRDLQTEEGRLPSIAPFGGGFGGQTYESAMILIVRELYEMYGDVDLVREYFPAMDRWMDAIGRAGLPGLPAVHELEWLGDWLAPEMTDRPLMYNAFHYRNAEYMVFFGELLGDTAAAEKYRRIVEETKAYWNKTFVDPETGMTKTAGGETCDTQGSYAFALSCGVFAEPYREKAFAHLARKTREGGHTIRTGFFATGALCPMLSEGGYVSDAQRLLTQTAYPSFLYPVTQGATTVWERWNSYTEEDGFGENNSMNSFNHYSLGSVVSWLYEYVLGIRRETAHPGYKHFTLQPEIGTFAYAKGGIDTPHGRIESAWEIVNGKAIYRCTVPANTTATVVLGSLTKEIGSGSYTFIVE